MGYRFLTRGTTVLVTGEVGLPTLRQEPVSMMAEGFYICGPLFLVPGVIQLTLLDERALLRQIQQLSRDPRLSTVLHMRQGAATRSIGQNRPPLILRDPSDTPSAAISSPQDTSQPRAIQDQDRPPRALLLPEIPVFPGSAVVDYHCSTLGIPSRGHAQMLDRLLAPAQRQFRPVSLFIFSQ